MTIDTDPRVQRSREAILNAARELLLDHGPAAVTHQRIAEQAGIGRATVYRHWPRTEQLLGEAMATVPMPFFDEPEAPFREWLTRELTAVARQLEHHDVVAVTTTLANSALWDPAMDTRRDGFAQLLINRLASALEAADAQGALRLACAATDVAALTIGPIYYRATIEHSTADTALIDHCVSTIGTWLPGTPP